MVVQVGRGRHFVSDLEVYVSASDIPIEIKLITFTKKLKAGDIFQGLRCYMDIKFFAGIK